MDLLYYNISSPSYNLSTACSTTNGIFKNLTRSYTQELHDTSTLSASFIMFGLTALFLILNFFSHLSDISAILDPKVRVGLSSALTLFLPVMSYLFSEAKHIGGGARDVDPEGELPQRARLILIWMLLVELLRKKVEEIRMQGYSGGLERAGRVLWLGGLVFSSLQAPGRRAMTGALWVLCATKLVQRIAFTEFGKRSLALGKNARLIASYMAQVLEKDDGQNHQSGGDKLDVLKRCKYAVMDEDRLVIQAIPGGYKLKEDTSSDVATVGKIWDRVESDPLLRSLDQDQRLRRLCLSFSLFKLLRRRFEHLPPLTTAETRSYRQIIFESQQQDNNKHTLFTGQEVFDMTNDELNNFLCEYYHSIIPVALASPFFLLANYFLVPIVEFALCFVVIVLCGNGDVPFAFRSIMDDNYFTYFGFTRMGRCLPQLFRSPVVFFCMVDFAITFLFFLAYIYETVWEFLVFLLSDWFLVSLLCKYATHPWWRHARAFRWSVRGIVFARNLMHRPPVSVNQFSVLSFCGVTVPAHIPLASPILVPTVPVPKQVKCSIKEHFTELCDKERKGKMTTAAAAVTLSKGSSTLAKHPDLLRYYKPDSSIAEIIITWHIATSILEVKRPPPSRSCNVAAILSKYCAYLVAFHPELLPENKDSVNRVFKSMKTELYDLLGFWGYYVLPCTRNTRCHKIMSCSNKPEGAVLVKGATLGSILTSKAEAWNLLDALWVELLVYLAPSRDEECVDAHETALAKGGEFLTLIWAMATHAGISRPDDDALMVSEDTEGTTAGASSV